MHRYWRVITFLHGAVLLSALWVALAGFGTAWADSRSAIAGSLRARAGVDVQVGLDDRTGLIRELRAQEGIDTGRPLRAFRGRPEESAARSFFATYGEYFGIADQDRELRLERLKQDGAGNSFARFRQTCDGIPVLAGEYVVKIGPRGRILAVRGESAPDPQVGARPTVTFEEAKATALELISMEHPDEGPGLEAGSPSLWIYNPRLMWGGPDVARLVWRLEVASTIGEPMNYLVLVDAHLGGVLLHFNQVQEALERKIYDKANSEFGNMTLPGLPEELVRLEGSPPSGIPAVDRAYLNAGRCHDFYHDLFGRDSLDNAGKKIIITVRYCAVFCPWVNGMWNGSQIIFGGGLSDSLEIMAHEYTHGVTQYESNLFYYMQSGAISEALSDIWGEAIQQYYEPGTALSKWLVGEEFSFGPVRSLKNPPAMGQPDRMNSPYYACTTSDDGGVHVNSGVGNKAFYLMVEGGTLAHDDSFQGMGMEKALALWYYAATNYLTSGSDYRDLACALKFAALDLQAQGLITQEDIATLKIAISQVEMDQPPACGAYPLPFCDQDSAETIYQENFDAGTSFWESGMLAGQDAWTIPSMEFASSGGYSMHGADLARVTDSYAAMTSSVPIPAQAYMTFRHAYQFEFAHLQDSDLFFDGGVLEYSDNEGSTWRNAGDLFLVNGYSGTLAPSNHNPLAEAPAFGGLSYGYTDSLLNLAPLAGKNVRFRFRIGTDHVRGSLGWYIDDLRIFTCPGPSGTLPAVILLLLAD